MKRKSEDNIKTDLRKRDSGDERRMKLASGSSPMTGFVINNVASSGSTTR
jgi:hypothetical protein